MKPWRKKPYLRIGLRRKLVVLSTFMILTAAGMYPFPAAAQSVLLPRATPVSSADGSHPYLGAAFLRVPENLDAQGYQEREYYLSGLSNAYQYNNPSDPMDDSVSSVQATPVSYVNRILVRTPKDPSRFSGNVIVDLADDVTAGETSAAWSFARDRFISNGDAYVLLPSLPSGVATLKTYNPVRYGPLNWPTVAATENACQAGPEGGIIYDEITQLGTLLKSNDGESPLSGYDVKRLFINGYSGSSITLLTYDRVFALHSNLFAGYMFTYGGPREPLNNCEPASVTYSRTQPPASTVSPVFQIQTASEITFFPAVNAVIGVGVNSDSPTNRYRYYEIAGASHIDGEIIRDDPQQSDVPISISVTRTTAALLATCGKTGDTIVNAFPDRYVHDALWANLETWAIIGSSYVPPIQSSALVIDDATLTGAQPQQGGLRSPAVDVPVDSYNPATILPTSVDPGTRMFCVLAGYQTPLPDKTENPLSILLNSLALTRNGFMTIEDFSRIVANPKLVYTYSDGTTVIPD